MTKEEYKKKRDALFSEFWGNMINLRSNTAPELRNSVAYLESKHRYYRQYFTNLEKLEDEYKNNKEEKPEPQKSFLGMKYEFND